MITTLRKALTLELRRALVTTNTPKTYADFTSLLFLVSSKLEEVNFIS